MALIVYAAIILATCTSCSTYKCYPSKKSKDYAINTIEANSRL